MQITKDYCDRCGDEIIYPAQRRLYLSGLSKEGGFDLCDSCHMELYNWFYKKSFPCIEGELAEMYIDGKWIKGKIVRGYRFDDGIVTIEDNNGKQYWCGQDRTDLYRQYEEVNANEI